MNTGKFVAHRLDSENVLYRGKVIELRSFIPTGYDGRYKIGKKRFTTQKQAKQYIDDLCVERGIHSFKNDEETQAFIAEWD